jgi:SAM-dependent methyltransferase
MASWRRRSVASVSVSVRVRRVVGRHDGLVDPRWRGRLRRALSPVRNVRRRATTAVLAATGRLPFAALPDQLAVDLSYEVLLSRRADVGGRRDFLRLLAQGSLDRRGVLDWMKGSEEFALHAFRDIGPSIHFGRGAFVRTLPRARRILDLGGSSQHSRGGALVGLGYPYRFEELVIVDLPSDERHQLYVSDDSLSRVDTHLGPVTYRYHSMADLSGYPDDHFDLVYSGQSLEHVTPDDGRLVVKEVNRVLRPGGLFAVDTPNATVCRLQRPDFIDPDHKVEYTAAELTELLTDAGLVVTLRAGLNWAGLDAAPGTFALEEAARNWGLFAEAEECYLLAFQARKPLVAR